MSTTPERPSAPEKAAQNSSSEQSYHTESLDSGLGDRTLLSSLWPYLRPHGFWLAVSIGSILLSALLALVRPLIMLYSIDQSIETRDPGVIFWGGLSFGVVLLVEQILAFVQTYAVQVLGARSMADLRRSTFEFLGKLPLPFFDRQPVGRLVTRVTNDVDALQELFNSGALNALGDILRLLGVIVIMLSLDAQLSLIAFASLPAVALLIQWVRKRARTAFRSIRGETARMNANMNEQINGVLLIQAFDQQSAKAVEFDEINSAYRDANIRSVRYEAIQDAAIDTVSAISLASLVVALGYHGATFGTVVALSAYLTQFFEPISTLAQRYTILQSALSGAERVFSLFAVQERDAPLLPPAGARSAPWEPADESAQIEFSHVTFGYKPEVDVLRDVSFTVKRGERIALVGPTGSGKTTITALLLRLYEKREGAIFLRGQEVSSLDRDELRRHFAVVPQDVFLFPGSLADNIAAGEEPQLERVERVLRQMGVYEMLVSRDQGLLAPVLPGGSNFSAGERQFIALARALYRNADILILDEATANIDSETEAKMQRALDVVLQGRTSIIVAHRLSTIRAADKILVLQKGRILESGSHEELIRSGGLYATLHQLQFAKE